MGLVALIIALKILCVLTFAFVDEEIVSPDLDKDFVLLEQSRLIDNSDQSTALRDHYASLLLDRLVT